MDHHGDKAYLLKCLSCSAVIASGLMAVFGFYAFLIQQKLIIAGEPVKIVQTYLKATQAGDHATETGLLPRRTGADGISTLSARSGIPTQEGRQRRLPGLHWLAQTTKIVGSVPMKARGKIAPSIRGLHLHVAASFFFFLVVSAPHRVHHFFEQGPFAPRSGAAHSHDAGDEGHDHQRAPQGTGEVDCTVQSLAQNAHAAAAPLIALPFERSVHARIDHPAFKRAASFNPSPFSQRAPPRA
jgi:hypothetical protein